MEAWWVLWRWRVKQTCCYVNYPLVYFQKEGKLFLVGFLWLWVELHTRLKNGATGTNQLISACVCLRVAGNSELEIEFNSHFGQAYPNFGKAIKPKTPLLKKNPKLWVRNQSLYIIFSAGEQPGCKNFGLITFGVANDFCVISSMKYSVLHLYIWFPSWITE